MPDATHEPREVPDRGRLIDFPRGRGSDLSPNNNLPLQLSSFIGREREIAEIGKLLADHRLLTLTGPGGCGKTRLALAVAGDLVKSFEEGVWWVELASLSDPDLVPQVVASHLGVLEQPGRPLTETIVEHLASRKLLLVLDNCGHLVASGAALADTFLRTCPYLRILATSREALGIAGEMAWEVPPLSAPSSQENLPLLDELGRYEAVRLFIERGNAVAPIFEVTEHNASAVARVLSVEQISQRLGDSFGLLTGGGRTTLPRQRTLRATIDWSYELLGEKEKVLFRRLSVFAGGFTLEAVEDVCSGEGLESAEVLDVLSHLVDKSLVLVAEQDDQARYRLLEMVRQYGREKLDGSGEEPSIRRRHAYFFLELAERVEPKINGKDRGLWLGRLDAEHDNLRATLAWSREEG